MFSRKMLVLRAVPRDISTRALSTSTARLLATPTDHHPRKETRQVPVDDIDVVFDYPSETQTAHQKIPLEDAGLDLHSAIPHGPKAGTPGAGKMKGVGTSESHFMYGQWLNRTCCFRTLLTS